MSFGGADAPDYTIEKGFEEARGVEKVNRARGTRRERQKMYQREAAGLAPVRPLTPGPTYSRICECPFILARATVDLLLALHCWSLQLPMHIQRQHLCRRLLLLLVAAWTVGSRPTEALVLPATSATSTSSPMVSPAYRQAQTMVSTANRQVELPSGRFTACWPIGLGSYNGAPAVFLSNKRRILDPREEVFPVPIDKEAVPLLSEASECTRPNYTWMGGVCLRYWGTL